MGSRGDFPDALARYRRPGSSLQNVARLAVQHDANARQRITSNTLDPGRFAKG